MGSSSSKNGVRENTFFSAAGEKLVQDIQTAVGLVAEGVECLEEALDGNDVYASAHEADTFDYEAQDLQSTRPSIGGQYSHSTRPSTEDNGSEYTRTSTGDQDSESIPSSNENHSSKPAQPSNEDHGSQSTQTSTEDQRSESAHQSDDDLSSDSPRTSTENNFSESCQVTDDDLSSAGPSQPSNEERASQSTQPSTTSQDKTILNIATDAVVVTKSAAACEIEPVRCNNTSIDETRIIEPSRMKKKKCKFGSFKFVKCFWWKLTGRDVVGDCDSSTEPEDEESLSTKSGDDRLSESSLKVNCGHTMSGNRKKCRCVDYRDDIDEEIDRPVEYGNNFADLRLEIRPCPTPPGYYEGKHFLF